MKCILGNIMRCNYPNRCTRENNNMIINITLQNCYGNNTCSRAWDHDRANSRGGYPRDIVSWDDGQSTNVPFVWRSYLCIVRVLCCFTGIVYQTKEQVSKQWRKYFNFKLKFYWHTRKYTLQKRHFYAKMFHAKLVNGEFYRSSFH